MFTDMTDDVAIIAALADLPNATSGLTAAQLKAKFDTASTLIKTYLNNTLTPELESTTAGDSGIYNIGMSNINGYTNPQLFLQYLYDTIGAISPAPQSRERQAIDNGNLDVAQRFPVIGAIMTNPINNQYILDRFYFSIGGTGSFPNISASRQALTPGDITNSYNYFRVSPDGAGTQSAVDSFYTLRQGIENGTRFLCGNGKKLTLSFWARSSISGKKFAVNLKQQYGTGGSPSASEELTGTVFNLTSTWTKYTCTFTTNTLVGKTFGTNNDDQLTLLFWYEWGSSFISRFGASTNESFVAAGNIDIAQVQVCAGEVALPYQPRSFSEVLIQCQRYYEKSYNIGVLPGTASSATASFLIVPSNTIASSQTYGTVRYSVRKRTTPTVTIYPYTTPSNTGRVSDNGGTDLGASSGTVTQSGDGGFTLFNNSGGSLTTVGNAIMFHWASESEI